MSELRRYDPSNFQLDAVRCYYCTKPGAQSRGAQQPASCGAYPCPEFSSHYKDPAAAVIDTAVSGAKVRSFEKLVNVPLVHSKPDIQIRSDIFGRLYGNHDFGEISGDKYGCPGCGAYLNVEQIKYSWIHKFFLCEYCHKTRPKNH